MNHTFDAHAHTHLSDAAPTESPFVVCKAAKAAGVGHLSITDHDRILPEPLRLELMRAFNLDIIPGCEFNAVTQIDDRQVTVHILGLWLPTATPPEELQSVLLRNQNQDFPAYSKAMLKKLLKLGIDPVARVWSRVLSCFERLTLIVGTWVKTQLHICWLRQVMQKIPTKQKNCICLSSGGGWHLYLLTTTATMHR